MKFSFGEELKNQEKEIRFFGDMENDIKVCQMRAVATVGGVTEILVTDGSSSAYIELDTYIKSLKSSVIAGSLVLTKVSSVGELEFLAEYVRRNFKWGEVDTSVSALIVKGREEYRRERVPEFITCSGQRTSESDLARVMLGLA